MRNPAVAKYYGTGKSRSKPLYLKSLRNVLIQHRGYLKLQAFYDAMIKKTAPVKTVHMSKMRQAVQRGLVSMKGKKRPLKLNIHSKSGTI